MSERARSFDAVAAAYERHRPDYPPEALEWAAARLGLEPGARVLDLGAGTGKLTRGLLALGFAPVAVEPGPAMLAELRAALPGVEAHEGAAEAIPLPEASVDAAVAGQAYHWFDHDLAPRELRRVIRPGGGLALLWNWWDVRDPLQRRVAALLDSPHGASFEPLPGPPEFERLGRTTVESVRESTPDALVGRVGTTSALVTASTEARERLLADVRALAAARGERFPLPQLTYVFAFRRLDALS